MLAVTQFSDTHFSTPGHRSHHGLGYDTDEAWARVAADAYGDPSIVGDLTIVTGDIADNGTPAEYDVAAQRLGDVPTPLVVLPGNHDQEEPFRAFADRTGLSADRTLEAGNWLFVFLDSNYEGKGLDADGRPVDYRTRRESNGRLGPGEMDFAASEIASSAADHVWLWMHHPPAMTGDTAAFSNPDFTDEVVRLVESHQRIRGVSAGHVHTDIEHTVGGRPLYLCPSLTINVDTTAWTWLPPGYRTYRFHDNGTVHSTVHFAEDPQWPRTNTPDAIADYFRGGAA
ncbi:MAG: metallophosphoesterase [Acidimicrobiaceae bacterium]|uniref:metallophosphoesterase n=1 Tax=Candidatus Poriferisodalis multihospitum TaxID=2983191 RepID=UPI00238E9030|nr:metallophosphoesterase [Candidatus Poriferisodalis multihospitum]MDE0135590.1 metallophosphoesterase [Acidimicrobiaceae bacterium]MDE0318697.1 metallophosphoesterase [Acidimicrobiaceae bacterium]MDE0497363.1 metallophosphoesterase [Acidimicrobiaceae bacterium]